MYLAPCTDPQPTVDAVAPGGPRQSDVDDGQTRPAATSRSRRASPLRDLPIEGCATSKTNGKARRQLRDRGSSCSDPITVATAFLTIPIGLGIMAHKVKFTLATDDVTLEAEELVTGETLACGYPKFSGHFGFFLPLAGISTIKEIKDSAVDVRATGRLNKLYLELLRENPDWAKEERRHDMNHFMARLIFCFFAEDTGIFEGYITKTHRTSVTGLSKEFRDSPIGDRKP